ncbi:class IIb bacteriocin, lactobin A/cerein 7B family [Sphingobacterium sp. lm-10]|nr:class IIb bacteriocin, lactobin A/cerein 7B family [Sphingobacterium sp. lm-10]MCL7989227.1 class IIb bacteriocin, lactobin A/cerein 7B family [Sphingobacterium sp. lm-10]
MKTLDVTKLGVQELNEKEMANIDGGIWPLLVVAAVAYFLTSDERQEN